MKNKTLLLLLLCAMPAPTSILVASATFIDGAAPANKPLQAANKGNGAAFSPWVGASSEKMGILNAGIAFLLPKTDADFSDLDVRDAQNHSIKSPSARQELETIFRENLLDLTVFGNSHSFNKALSWIESISYLFNKSVLVKLSAAFELVQDAILPSFRRFVHNVDNLCISFTVGLLAIGLLLSAFSLQRTPRKVHLRC
jgi:hypothetical protein